MAKHTLFVLLTSLASHGFSQTLALTTLQCPEPNKFPYKNPVTGDYSCHELLQKGAPCQLDEWLIIDPEYDRQPKCAKIPCNGDPKKALMDDGTCIYKGTFAN